MIVSTGLIPLCFYLCYGFQLVYTCMGFDSYSGVCILSTDVYKAVYVVSSKFVRTNVS